MTNFHSHFSSESIMVTNKHIIEAQMFKHTHTHKHTHTQMFTYCGNIAKLTIIK